MADTQPLSDYWDTFQLGGTQAAPVDSPIESPLSLRFRPEDRQDRPDNRNRAFSDAMVLETFRPALTPFHPASSLPDFLDCFGPLIFPLYRAALLRKRILFMNEAPVHTPCNYGNCPVLEPMLESLLTRMQCMIYRCWHLSRTLFSKHFRLTAPHRCDPAPCSTLAFMISPSSLPLIPLGQLWNPRQTLAGLLARLTVS